MKILIVGTGYVGLVTGACFAEKGHSVICLDIDQKKIDLLNKGVIPFYEPGLEELVTRNVEEQRLTFTTDYHKAVNESLLCFLAVSTPQGEDGSANTTFLLQAARQIAHVMTSYKIIINKSTVPVGSTHHVAQAIQEVLDKRASSIAFDVVSNPEFLKEGDAIQDFMQPDRIVIGTHNAQVALLMQELYAPFSSASDRLLIMDPASAEMTKYASNAMLASRISFMNEIALLCEKLGADVSEVRKGMGTDRRIGSEFLNAGAGYGGSCFPKDVQALIAEARSLEQPAPLLEAIETVNKRQKHLLAEKVLAYFKEDVVDKTFGIWGLSFKPGTDDMREAPSLVLIRTLLAAGAHLRLYDPIAMKRAQELLKKSPQITWCHDPYDAATATDALILVTEWKHFREIDFDSLFPLLKGKVFFDGRNQFLPHEMAALGFEYFSIGRPSIQAPAYISNLT